MDLRLAMLDIDGTLRHKGDWFPGAVELVQLLAQSGLEVALCSGRTTGSMFTLAAELPEVTWITSNSGATALRKEADGWKLMAHRALPVETVQAGVKLGDELGVEIWAHTAHDWLIREETPLALGERKFVGDGFHVEDFTTRDDIGKLLFRPETDEQMAEIRKLAALPGAAVVASGATTNFGYADLLPEQAPIAKGGDLLVEALGIEWSQVVSAGDGENDMGMLGHAQMAVAMPPLKVDSLARAGDQVRLQARTTMEALQLIKERL